uniref:CYRIA/CYRIB Rac1 binding domain-containing protein n=1 Tax=Gasterosteus aculeatus aculeatus TaxID=481459 RepID=A0AAQ4RTW4_GASAC
FIIESAGDTCTDVLGAKANQRGSMDILESLLHLEQKQALARQFAHILHFTLRFDELKVCSPISYPCEQRAGQSDVSVLRQRHADAEDAQRRHVKNVDVPIENTTDCLSTMASVCKVMLETPEYRSRFASEETVLFCLRVMVGVIILYDHVHPAGAFVKTCNIDMKGCIRVLKEQPPSSVEGLLNALRYTTKHLNDEATSKQIKNMLQPN